MIVHLDGISSVELKCVTSAAGRYYITPENNKYSSITTILGAEEKPWLTLWKNSLGINNANKEMKRAADRGTAVHDMIEQFLNNNPTPTKGHQLVHIPDFNMMKLFLKKINNILTLETALWSDELKCAGRVDCVGEYNGKLSIIDFKTSTNNKNLDDISDYFLQTTAYALMFQERYNIQIDNLVIIMSVEKGAVPLIFEQAVDKYIHPLLLRINNYHTTREIK